MKLVTIQASAFKSTFEVLKDILNDVNIYFKSDGMYIVTLDTARTSLVDMFLSAENFEEYHFLTQKVERLRPKSLFRKNMIISFCIIF